MCSPARQDPDATEHSVDMNRPHFEINVSGASCFYFSSALHYASESLAVPIWPLEQRCGSTSQLDITIKEDQDGGSCPAISKCKSPDPRSYHSVEVYLL